MHPVLEGMLVAFAGLGCTFGCGRVGFEVVELGDRDAGGGRGARTPLDAGNEDAPPGSDDNETGPGAATSAPSPAPGASGTSSEVPEGMGGRSSQTGGSAGGLTGMAGMAAGPAPALGGSPAVVGGAGGSADAGSSGTASSGSSAGTSGGNAPGAAGEGGSVGGTPAGGSQSLPSGGSANGGANGGNAGDNTAGGAFSGGGSATGGSGGVAQGASGGSAQGGSAQGGSGGTSPGGTSPGGSAPGGAGGTTLGGAGGQGACTPSNGGFESCDGLDNDCSLGIDDLGCPATCRGVAIAGNGYMFCDQEIDRTSAVSACTAQGLHLVKLDGAQEDLAIFEEAYSTSVKYYWIGAFQDPSLGWTWPDGTPLSYSHWFAGEPSGNRDCAQVDETGQWRSVPCPQSKRYVCELFY